MKEFTIEDYTINSDLSVDIQYFFYSEFKEITFTQEQIEEVFEVSNLHEWLNEDFDQADCKKLLIHFTREYAQSRKEV